MTPQEFDKIVQRYLHGTCTPREKKLVEDWFNSIANDNQVQLDDNSKRAIRQEILSKINTQIGVVPAPIRRNIYRSVFRYAASIGLLAVAVYVIRLSLPAHRTISERRESISTVPMIDVVNETASNQQVLLKDGSSVLLEPGSAIRYPENFQEKREVNLKGAAFFQVTKDKEHPFYVNAGNVITRVVGTSFRVNASDDKGKVTVSVATGKVSVYSRRADQAAVNANSKLMLSPNQEAIYDPVKEELSQRLVDQPQVISSMPDVKMKFINTPAAEIFEALEEAYGIDLEFNRDAFAGCALTTDLDEEEFYQRIDALCHALNAEYQVTESSVIIRSNGCN